MWKKGIEDAEDALESPEEIKIYDYTRDQLRRKYGLSWHGKLPHRDSVDIERSMVGIGMETLDRDTYDPNDIYGFLAESGVKWARLQTGWLKCERRKGVYDFRWLDDLVDNLVKIGIQPWFSVSFGNPLYTPNEYYDNFARQHPDKRPPGDVRGYVGEVPLYHGAAAIEGWCDYLTALAGHFNGRVAYWEIWNEPDHLNRFWRHKGKMPYPEIDDDLERVRKCARDYVEFVKISGTAIKTAIPQARIVGAVANMTPNEYLRELKAGNLAGHIDVFAGHYYGLRPECDAREKSDFMKAMISSPGKEIEYWMGESGRRTGPFGCNSPYPTEYNQAKYLVRRFVIDLNCGLKMSSFFTASDLTGYYADGADQQYGVIHGIEKRPKLAYSALQAMAWLFDGIEKVEDLFISMTPVHDAQFYSAIDYSLQTGAFRRRGIPVFCAYRPESIDISASPVTGQLIVSVASTDKFQQPIVIDPIRRNIYRISHMTRPAWGKGLYVINPFTLVDYPLFITDISLLDM